jgi:hypothetical protein
MILRTNLARRVPACGTCGPTRMIRTRIERLLLKHGYPPDREPIAAEFNHQASREGRREQVTDAATSLRMVRRE